MGWWSGDGGSLRPYFLNARCAFGRGMNCGAVTLSSEAQHRCLGEGIKAGAVMAWASQSGQTRVTHQR